MRGAADAPEDRGAILVILVARQQPLRIRESSFRPLQLGAQQLPLACQLADQTLYLNLDVGHWRIVANIMQTCLGVFGLACAASHCLASFDRRPQAGPITCS